MEDLKAVHHKRFLELRKKLHDFCVKANAEMSQEELMKMLEDAVRWREQFPDRDSYIKYMREQIKQQFPDG